MSSNNILKIKDCALIAMATGKRATTYREFHDLLQTISVDSIYYHFWGGLLQARFEEREYNNDFAAWVRHGLHDPYLAERLAVIDPSDYADMERLRQELVEQVELRLDENDALNWIRAVQPFDFIRSSMVVFESRRSLEHLCQLADLIPSLSIGSIFYHFIDAQRRTSERCDDFRLWLRQFGEKYSELDEHLANVDPYFRPLTELRHEIAELCRQYC